MKTPLSIFLLLILIIMTISCSKSGLGGKNTLVIYPYHHSWVVRGIHIYIKYGGTTFPGTDPGKYDDSAISKSTGGGNAFVSFPNLKKGNYYLWGVGYDSTVAWIVRGGAKATISESTGETDFDLTIDEKTQ